MEMTDIYDLWINRIIRWFGAIPIFVYIIVAIFLTIIAIASLIITGFEIYLMFIGGETSSTLVDIIYSILLTVIIVELFETVTVYLRTKRVPVRAILIAGMTALVRHVIILNITELSPAETFGIAILMAVFVGGIYLLREEGFPIKGI